MWAPQKVEKMRRKRRRQERWQRQLGAQGVAGPEVGRPAGGTSSCRAPRSISMAPLRVLGSPVVATTAAAAAARKRKGQEVGGHPPERE